MTSKSARMGTPSIPTASIPTTSPTTMSAPSGPLSCPSSAPSQSDARPGWDWATEASAALLERCSGLGRARPRGDAWREVPGALVVCEGGQQHRSARVCVCSSEATYARAQRDERGMSEGRGSHGSWWRGRRRSGERRHTGRCAKGQGPNVLNSRERSWFVTTSKAACPARTSASGGARWDGGPRRSPGMGSRGGPDPIAASSTVPPAWAPRRA